MLSSAKRAAGALLLLALALSGAANAASDHVIVSSAPHHPHDATDPTFGFQPIIHKNKLSCEDAPGAAPGAIMFDNWGPGTLTVGMIVKVVIQPTGRVISYTLPYDLPPMNGVMWYNAYPPGIEGVTCTFTATPNPGGLIMKPPV